MAGKSALIRLIHPDWPAPAAVGALSTTRHGGYSSGPYSSLNLAGHVGDDPRQVERNRRALEQAAGLPHAPHWLRQVHGTTVADLAAASVATEADAAISFEAGQVCAVQTADCLPVLICSDDGRGVAAVHAGWRGLAGGIVEVAVRSFREHGVLPGRLMAWLGPAISAPAYEVGAEVRDLFMAADGQSAAAFTRSEDDRWQLDLYVIARQRLAAAGIERVFGGRYCTFSDCVDGQPRFFSYRRDGRCGRQATLIWHR